VFTEAFSSLFSLQSKEQCPKLGKIEGRMLAAYVVSPSGHAWIVLFCATRDSKVKERVGHAEVLSEERLPQLSR
jgi:hypothetical protein